MTTKKDTATKSTPRTKKAPTKRAASKLAQAAANGDVRFYRQRTNGTYRRLPYLAPGTEMRKQAEAVAARRSEGETIPVIADSLSVSKATVRPLETGLLLAQAVEAGEHDKSWDGKAGDLILETTAS